MDYIYRGDKFTDESLKMQECSAVRRANGKCIRGRNSNMLVEFSNGVKVVVLARLLRKIKRVSVAAEAGPHSGD